MSQSDPDNSETIYLCGAFWEAPPTGTDSQAGTLIYAASRFTANGGAEDYARGQTSCQSLATSDPTKAISNADTYQYFAENTPYLD